MEGQGHARRGRMARDRLGGVENSEPSDEAVDLRELVSLPMFEEPANAQLAPAIRHYVAGGAADEHTLRSNVDAWAEIGLAPRTLVDVSSLATETQLLGIELAHPIMLAPTAQHRAYHPLGESATLQGARAADALCVMSSLGATSLAELGAAAGSDPWFFQLYVQRDRGFTEEVVRRAVAAGAKALVLTVDTPTLGARDRDKRNQLGRIDGYTYPILADAPTAAEEVAPHRRIFNPLLAPDITWSDLEWLVEISPVPVVTKGHLRGDDAARAVDCGAAAVIVSNHGARNLDTVPATATALPFVVDAVADRVPVLVDGGIRRGTDVVKALLLGASAVLVGRPIIWGLTLGGAAGVQQVIEILRTELEMAMALLGAPTLADLTPDLLWPTYAAEATERS